MPIENEKSKLKIPTHLAVTMDGNGRWANERNMARTKGHSAGIDALRRLVKYCINYNVKYLTIFSFSSENWSRPKEEVNFILRLMRQYVESDLEKLAKNSVKINVIGERKGLDKTILNLIEKAENRTKNNNGLELIIAFNYGSRGEIVSAVKKIAQKVKQGEVEIDDINENLISNSLYLPNFPDPDLILRTSGELRLSNFLLWQAAYSELVFIDDYWPDFDEKIFIKVLKEYSKRNRRFGGLATKV